ncbi:MAG: 2-amino-4-hydroxy-6-hydroxymethyldihydropteridine diphosphokinase [Rubrivivax sp.]
MSTPSVQPLHVAHVGLGANLGDAQQAVRRALQALAALPQTRLQAASGLYRSAPVDAQGPDFVNAVARLHTALAPRALLDELQRIEQRFGRQRPYRHAPRTLDLDLLLYGSVCQDDERLRLPHPRLHLRRFVLEPLLEIEPALSLPGLGPAAALLPALAGQAVWRMD